MGERLEFNEVHFELQNKVLNKPSSVDIVLKKENKLLLIESKLIEIVRDCVGIDHPKQYKAIADNKGKRNEASVAYFKKRKNSYLSLFKEMLKDYRDFIKIGFDLYNQSFETIDNKESGYVAMNPISDFKYTYPDGIKQFLCHLIGIKNIEEKVATYDQTLREEILKDVDQIYFLTLYNELPGFEEYDSQSVEKINNYIDHYKEVEELLKSRGNLITKINGKEITINLCGALSYQKLYEQNIKYFAGLDRIVEFYKLKK